MSFIYKGGSSLQNMVADGNGTVSGYTGLNIANGVNTSDDKLGGTDNLYQYQGSDIGVNLPAKYTVYNCNQNYTSNSQYQTYNVGVPTWANKVGVAAIAGGGGGSGGGGHAVAWWGIDARQPGGNGKEGGEGGNAYGNLPVSGVATIQVRVGRGGDNGGGGGHSSSPNQDANAGEGGRGYKGGESGIVVPNVGSIIAGGGNYANGGWGGNVNDNESGTYQAAQSGSKGNKGNSVGNSSNFMTSRLDFTNKGKKGNQGNGGNNDRADGNDGGEGSSGQVYIVWKTN